jgi:hypothetical protein
MFGLYLAEENPFPNNYEFMPWPYRYLQLKGNLEYWKRRHFSTVSWSAVEMLYSERQLKWFKQDMDVPRLEPVGMA